MNSSIKNNKRKKNSLDSSLYFDDGLLDTFFHARHIVEKYDKTGILAIATGCVANQTHSRRFMNKEQIKTMIESGWRIAGHSVTHSPFVRPKSKFMELLYKYGFLPNFFLRFCSLVSLSDEETEWEVLESKRWITEELGVDPVCFVFPYTIYTEQQKKIILRHYPYIRNKVIPFHSISRHSKEKQRLKNFLEGRKEIKQLVKN